MSPIDMLRKQARRAAKRDGRHGIPSDPDQPGLPAFVNTCLSAMTQQATGELYAYAEHVRSSWEEIGNAKSKIVHIDERIDQLKTQLAGLTAPTQPASRVDMFRHQQRLRPLNEQLAAELQERRKWQDAIGRGAKADGASFSAYRALRAEYKASTEVAVATYRADLLHHHHASKLLEKSLPPVINDAFEQADHALDEAEQAVLRDRPAVEP